MKHREELGETQRASGSLKGGDARSQSLPTRLVPGGRGAGGGWAPAQGLVTEGCLGNVITELEDKGMSRRHPSSPAIAAGAAD